MLNEFLTHILQVIIVLDVLGLVAYFVLCARRSRMPEAVAAVPAPAPTPAASRMAPTLWTKLTRSRRLQPAPTRPAPSMDGALCQLRRVLDSYRSSLA